MSIQEKIFENENGNQIFMSVWSIKDGIGVIVVSPNSNVEHIWTRQEAEVLRDLLTAEL